MFLFYSEFLNDVFKAEWKLELQPYTQFYEHCNWIGLLQTIYNVIGCASRRIHLTLGCLDAAAMSLAVPVWRFLCYWLFPWSLSCHWLSLCEVPAFYWVSRGICNVIGHWRDSGGPPSERRGTATQRHLCSSRYKIAGGAPPQLWRNVLENEFNNVCRGILFK